MIVESPTRLVRGSIVVTVKRRQWMNFVTVEDDKGIAVPEPHGTTVLDTEVSVLNE